MATPTKPLSLFNVFITIFFLSPQLSSASDNITTTQPLSGSQKLISSGGNFELGFFKPGNSPYYYIGIWYSLTQVSQLTPVWVANRETPIADHTKTELKISSNGNLILSNQSNPLIWSTNTTTTSNSTVAVLLDSGNLVLRDRSNPNVTFWQSLDHPTHTWLPGGKIGLNKVTHTNQKLVSWRNNDDPAPGIFSLELDPNGTSQYFILWNNSFNYWSSGTWNGQIFSGVPEMTANYIYDFEYVSNATENYFTYSIKNGHNITSRFIMDVSGQIKQLTWLPVSGWNLFWSQPRAQCQVHALCGPYGSCTENVLPPCNCIKGFGETSQSEWGLNDFTGGCSRNTQLQCGEKSNGKVEKDRFYMMSSMGLPDNSQSLQAGSASDCENGCLNNCSCTAYSFNSSGCSVWFGELLNLQEQSSGQGGGTLFLRLAASELPNSKSDKGVIIGAVIGGIAACLTLILIAWLIMRKRSRMGKSKVVEGGLIAFRFSDLQQATKNFSEKLGEGGFGSVFKGVLSDSTAIAVKKLEGLRQGEKQFRTEVSTIGTVQHVNLVRLRGFCSEGDNKLLVYEYMPNGSLDTQLFLSDGSTKVLDWKTRFQIALGTARGLTYLHEQCRDCIVHCDIKPENILLDATFVPKVADFGLAKLIGRDFSRVLTTMRGTRGYLAPEWISGVAITAKADVYSYGMMLFEIISGKRNSEHGDGNKHGFFPAFAASKLKEGDTVSLMDHRLMGNANLEEIVRACKVACWCIQDDEDVRPSMGQVVKILEGLLEVNMPPIPRGLQILADNQEDIVFYTESSSSSKTHSTTASQTKSASSLNSTG